LRPQNSSRILLLDQAKNMVIAHHVIVIIWLKNQPGTQQNLHNGDLYQTTEPWECRIKNGILIFSKTLILSRRLIFSWRLIFCQINTVSVSVWQPHKPERKWLSLVSSQAPDTGKTRGKHGENTETKQRNITETLQTNSWC